MTIREYVSTKKPMPINEWINAIQADNLLEHESVILSCADSMGKIIFSGTYEKTSFVKCINKL